MDYFAVGGRPLLSGFPPFISGNIGPKLREISQKNYAEAEASSAHLGVNHFHPGQAFPSSSTTAEPITDSAMCVDEAVPKASWGRKAPVALHTAFEPKTVSRWEPGRFEMVRKLQDATRNRGQVHLMNDVSSGRLVAVKQIGRAHV